MKTIFIFLILFSNFAKALEITLDRTNHMGLRVVDILKKKDDSHFFDGKNIGKKLPASIQKSWLEIETGPGPSKKPVCASGHFIYIKTEKNKERVIRGCTEGGAYGNLIQNIENIRTYAKQK